MIEKLQVTNFKSIGPNELSIELKPLTIITGPNGSGKSSILEAIATLAQATRLKSYPKSFERGLRDGEFVKVPRIGAILHREQFSEVAIKLTCQRSKIEGTIAERDPLSSNQIQYSFAYASKEKILRQTFSLVQPLCTIARRDEENQPPKAWVMLPNDSRIHECSYEGTEDISAERFLHRQFLANFPRFQKELQQPVRTQNSAISMEVLIKRLKEAIELCSLAAKTLNDVLGRVFLISSNRGAIPFQVTVGGVLPDWVGINGERILELLSAIFASRKYYQIEESILCWARRFGIDNLKAGWRGENALRSDFEDSVLSGTSLDLPLASYGSRQVLTIIVQIFWSEPEDVIMIEEPEISLHPQSQLTLQELFAEAIKQGKQIIITTHSPIMLLALSRLVKEGKIPSEKIAIYEVTKGKDGSVARHLPIDKKGYIENWIPSFKLVEDDLFKDWAEGLEDK